MLLHGKWSNHAISMCSDDNLGPPGVGKTLTAET